MLIKPFETKRLILRPITGDDAKRLFLLDSNPEVMKYIGIPFTSSISETRLSIDEILSQYERFGIGRYAVVHKQTKKLIGWSGLKFNSETINGYSNFYELGYRFLPEFWGQGLAQESSKEFIKIGFEELYLNKIFAYAHSENAASNNALLKLGFKCLNKFIESDDLCYWFEISKSDFLCKST